SPRAKSSQRSKDAGDAEHGPFSRPTARRRGPRSWRRMRYRFCEAHCSSKEWDRPKCQTRLRTISTVMAPMMKTASISLPLHPPGVNGSFDKPAPLSPGRPQPPHTGPDSARPREFGFRKECESFLRTVLEKNLHRDVQGQACLSLGLFLNGRLHRLDLL